MAVSRLSYWQLFLQFPESLQTLFVMVEDNSIIQIHGIFIDPPKCEVSIEGKLVTLTRTEFLLLHFLASHAGTGFTRQEIINATHGSDYPVTERSVDVQVTGLRKKLGDSGRLIEAVRGVGYRFRAEGPIGPTTDVSAGSR